MENKVDDDDDDISKWVECSGICGANAKCSHYHTYTHCKDHNE
jgi:hypothetical protein